MDRVELMEAVAEPIVGFRDLTAEDEKNINTVYKAATAYAKLLPLLQELVEAREKATAEEWLIFARRKVGKDRNNTSFITTAAAITARIKVIINDTDR